MIRRIVRSITWPARIIANEARTVYQALQDDVEWDEVDDQLLVGSDPLYTLGYEEGYRQGWDDAHHDMEAS